MPSGGDRRRGTRRRAYRRAALTTEVSLARSPGRWPNADEEDERTREAYRAGYTRLSRVKARYDRDNFFRVNRNISPAS